MSACDAYLEKLLLSVDGELSSEEEEALQAHLKVCDRCRCLYSAYRDVQCGIVEMDETPPETLSASVMRQIRREKRSGKRSIKNYRFTLLAAAACFVLVLAGKGLNFGGSSANAMMTTEDAVAQEAAPAEVADETALIPAYDPERMERTAEAPQAMAETAETEATDEDAAPVEYAVTEEAQDDPVDKVFGVGEASDALSELRLLLEQKGYFGDLVEMQDMTEETLLEIFPECEKLIIDAYVVYQVSCEDFEAVEPQMHYGTVVSTETLGDSVFLYLGA